jgi:hypothetical protein
MRQDLYHGAEMLVYDDSGICSYLRLDDVHMPHDIATLDDGTVLVVAPVSNAILAVSPGGSTRVLWSVNAPFDAWHLNCAVHHEGRLYATAFGRFNRPRGWNLNCDRTGILFDTETGKDVVTGLTQPHTPRWIDDAWMVCDSGVGHVLRITADGRQNRIDLGGFPRGMCAVGDRVYVGVSDRRASREQSVSAHIAVLDRATWKEVDRIPTQGGSIYDIVSVDEATWNALQIGFGFCCGRRQALDQLAMFEAVGVRPSRLWAVGERLDQDGCRIAIEATIPSTFTAEAVVWVCCTVTNRGNALLVSAPPHPVLLSYKWFDATGAPWPAIALRTSLPATIRPGQSLDVNVCIAAPEMPGRYTLTVTALQELIHWFDEVDMTSAFRVSVGVTEQEAPARACQPK